MNREINTTEKFLLKKNLLYNPHSPVAVMFDGNPQYINKKTLFIRW